MKKYYEFNHPGPVEQSIALPIPARLVETFSKSGIVFAPTPQGEAMSDLFYFFWTAIVHFYMQRKRVNTNDAAVREGNAFVLPAGLPALPNIVDAANPPAVPGAAAGAAPTTEETNEDGRETHFMRDGERYPFIAAFWETMHGGNSSKPIGYVLWIASWAPNGLSKLVSSHLKRCLAFKNDLKAKPPCKASYYSIVDPVLMIKRIDDVFTNSTDERDCAGYVDFRAYKTHAKHPVQFFAPERLPSFFENGWSVSAGIAPNIDTPPLPWMVQCIPFHVISSRSCTWDFPHYYLSKQIAEILCNTGGEVSDTARVSIEDAIEAAIRERTINMSCARSDYFHEISNDLLSYLRERNALDDNVSDDVRLESGERLFRDLPSMMTLPCEENGFVGNVSAGQYAVFSTMSRIPLPSITSTTAAGDNSAVSRNKPLFEMVTKDLSPASNVLLKIISMFHDLMGVHYGNRMCMTMSCFVNNLGCARPYVGTGLLACIGLFGPKALGKNRAHDAAATLINKHVVMAFASVTNAIFRTNSNYNGMLLAVLETPKELLGIDGTGQACSTPLSEVFKELLTSGGEVRSLNYNGGTREQNLRTTTLSSFHAKIAARLICNFRREWIEKSPTGSRIMMLENANFADAIDAQGPDSFVDEHSGDAIESTLSTEGHEWKNRMRVLFDVFYIYCAFQQLGQLPLLPEEPIRMVLDGMNGRLRKRGYDGYTMRVGTQMTNEVRALSTFLNIAMWWESGLGAAYRAQHNCAFLNFAVLVEISRHQRVLEDAIVFVFSQNISLVQSPLRQTVSDKLRELFKAPEGNTVRTWNEHFVSDKVAPNPAVHLEESVSEQRLRENYVQLTMNVAELRRILSDQLKIPVEEITTALNQIRDREQCTVDGMPHAVYKTRGLYTDQKGYFLKCWILGEKNKKKGHSGDESANIYSEFENMLYKCMSLDRTVPTRCITMFPSEVDGAEIAVEGMVRVLGVPAAVTLERRPHEFQTFSRPANSFYFKTSSGVSRHRTTDGEWVQRGFPLSMTNESRVVITHELLERVNGVFTSVEYPRAGLERAMLEQKERVLARDMRKYLPRVMPHYSRYSDCWMPGAETAFFACAPTAPAASADSISFVLASEPVTDSANIGELLFGSQVEPPASQHVQDDVIMNRAERERLRKEKEERKDQAVSRYQRVRTTHQSSMYGLFCLATACRRWCENVLDANFKAAEVLERYISALQKETRFSDASQSFSELYAAQESVVSLLTHESAAMLTGFPASKSAPTGFSCVLDTLPALNSKERAFMSMYIQYADLRPIEKTCVFIRPDYHAGGGVIDDDVSRVTAAYDAFKKRIVEVQAIPSSRVRVVSNVFTVLFLTEHIKHGVTDGESVRKCIERINMARRDIIACIACGDFLTACAVEEQVDAALVIIRQAVSVLHAGQQKAVMDAVANVTVTFSGKVQAAWGSAYIQRLLPLKSTWSQIVFDSTLMNGAVQVKQHVENDEPLMNAQQVNSLLPSAALLVKRHRRSGDEHVHSSLAEESDEEEPNTISLQDAWTAAFLLNKTLPCEMLSSAPVSGRMRETILECSDRSTVTPHAKGTSIVTPQSLSYILFR